METHIGGLEDQTTRGKSQREEKIIRKKRRVGGRGRGVRNRTRRPNLQEMGLTEGKGTGEDEVIIRHTVEENFLGRSNSPY